MLAVVQSGYIDIPVVLGELSEACVRDQPTVHIQRGGMNEMATSTDL